jgi:hypothetical protein
MEILPEGKVQISSSANLKDRIDGIQFSSQGYEVWITKVVDEKDQKKTEEVLDSTVQRLVKEYYDKLAKEITTTRNELIDTLRAELSAEYDEKLKKAKEIILEQREEIKLLKNK